MSKRAPKTPDDFATRLLKYMADMGMPEAMSDQEQNQTMRLVGQFAERELRHVRRVIANELGYMDRLIADTLPKSEQPAWKDVRSAIDAATRAPRKGRAR